MTAKACRECHELKPATAFLPSRFRADGLTDRCRDCILDGAMTDDAGRVGRHVRPGGHDQQKGGTMGLTALARIISFPRQPRSNSAEIKGLPSVPSGSAVASGPRPPGLQAAPAVAAVRSFLVLMLEEAAGGELQWKRIRHSYAALRAERGWPVLADQTLSGFLVALGCQRRRARVPGGGRVTVFTFPTAPDFELAKAS